MIDTNMLAQVATVAIASVASLTVIGIGAHAYFTRARRAGVAQLPADDGRMARVEQAIEAIAIEVERISEGQRFTTRLLTERGAEGDTSPDAAGTRGVPERGQR